MSSIADPNKQLSRYLENGTKELREHLAMTIVSGNDRELDRITRYHLFWNFYEGKHYRDMNDNMLAFNYVKAFIDKINQFLLGTSGFSFKVNSYYNDVIPEEIEKMGEELLMYHWRKNNKNVTAQEILQMGSICGDVWVMPYWDEEKKYVAIRTLDSRTCYPEFEDGDTSKLKSFLVRQKLEKHPSKYTIKVTRYTKEEVQTWYQLGSQLILDPGKNSPLTKQHSEVKEFKSVTNSLEYVPIVHIKNKPNSSDYYSKSDANDILKLNKVFNELNQEMKTIIDYHVAPVTVVTGATMKNAKRGIGQVWSGLPAEANVFTLGLDADLSAMSQYIKDLKQYMHEISDVPENVLGKIQAISGTSAAALRLTYQPLVQQADLKALTYGEGFTEINRIILDTLGKYDPKNTRLSAFKEALKTAKLEIPDIFVEPVFAYGFPTDRLAELNEASIELNLKLGSRKEVMNRLGKNNVPDLQKEIEEEMLKDADIQRRVVMTSTVPVEPVPGAENPGGQQPVTPA